MAESDDIDDMIKTLQERKAKLDKGKKGLQEEDLPERKKETMNVTKKSHNGFTGKKGTMESTKVIEPDNSENDRLKEEIERLKKESLENTIKSQNSNKMPFMRNNNKNQNTTKQHIQAEAKNSQNNEIPKNSNTIDIIQKLQGNKAFVTTAQKYGTALAATILAKSSTGKSNRVNFEDEARKTIELKSGSYAIIYKNITPVRISPYVWSLDQQTRRTWAVFTFYDFYGQKVPWQPWKRLSTPIVLTPVSHTSAMADNFGKGYLSKFDEGTQYQVSLHLAEDDTTTEKILSENKNFLSAGLTLWMDLQQYTKNKMNLKMILIIVIVIAVAVLGYYIFKTHPGLLSNILPHT